MAIKQIRRQKKDQSVQILLTINCQGDTKPSSVIYHITETDWELIDSNTKYPLYLLPPIMKGLKYMGLPYKDMDELWNEGVVELFYADKIE